MTPGTIMLWPAHLDPPPGWRWWQPQHYYPTLDEYSVGTVWHHIIREPWVTQCDRSADMNDMTNEYLFGYYVATHRGPMDPDWADNADYVRGWKAGQVCVSLEQARKSGTKTSHQGSSVHQSVAQPEG